MSHPPAGVGLFPYRTIASTSFAYLMAASLRLSVHFSAGRNTQFRVWCRWCPIRHVAFFRVTRPARRNDVPFDEVALYLFNRALRLGDFWYFRSRARYFAAPLYCRTYAFRFGDCRYRFSHSLRFGDFLYRFSHSFRFFDLLYRSCVALYFGESRLYSCSQALRCAVWAYRLTRALYFAICRCRFCANFCLSVNIVSRP